ncbi:UNVERIFIED_CONTAM: hypothetical protein FKN15_002103 [Acipenser sinensis]
MEKSEKISNELIQSIGNIQTEVTGLNQAKARMKKLEQETAELWRRNAELKQLSKTEDHIHFLQNIQSLCAPPEAGDLPSFTVNTDISFVAVRKAVTELKGHIEDCKQKLVKITTTGTLPETRLKHKMAQRPFTTEKATDMPTPSSKNNSDAGNVSDHDSDESRIYETYSSSSESQDDATESLFLTTAKMAEANILVAEDQFICPVCLEIFKDPITITCGHSYCMTCIQNYWGISDLYSCPQCRQIFNQKPVLGRNIILAEVVEKLKKTGLNPPPAQNYAGPGDVPCDFCTGRKFKAVKSCLMCLASYCETHVNPHSEVTALKRHKLINAIGNLEQKLCAEHQRLCEVFCRTDQTCICWLCADKEHKSHDTVSAETERTGKQSSAQKEIKTSERIFTELIRSIEKIHTEVIELIGANKKAAVNQAEGRMKKLEQEIAELRRRNAELKELSETEDHIHFLQNFQSLCAPPEAGNLPSLTVNTDISFVAVRKAVSELKDHIEDFCKGELVEITKTG